MTTLEGALGKVPKEACVRSSSTILKATSPHASGREQDVDTRSAREVEDGHAGNWAQQTNELALPQAVEAKGHHVVHDVVARGNLSLRGGGVAKPFQRLPLPAPASPPLGPRDIRNVLCCPQAACYSVPS